MKNFQVLNLINFLNLHCVCGRDVKIVFFLKIDYYLLKIDFFLIIDNGDVKLCREA